VFQIPTTIPPAEAVREGWVRPIDDLIPNFEAWQAAFPPASFVEGVNVFDGRVYTFPRSTSKRGLHLTFYNRQLMQEAGYDPETTLLTWDGFRDAAAKITEAGNGSAYGVILAGQQTGRWQDYVRNLGRLAGSSAGPDDIDYRTGEYAFTSDGYLAAIDLLLALRDDGSVFPGSMALNDPQARAQTPQGVAGMILEGEWTMPIWIRESPDFDFGVTGLPVPDENFVPETYQNTATNHQWVFAESKYPEIAGEIFYYLGSEAGQLAFVSITGGSDPSIYQSANDNAPLDERMRAAYTIFDERMRLGPDVRVRNPEASRIYLNLVQPTPSFGETVQGIYAGQLEDPRAAMQDLKDRYEAALDEAIAAAQGEGANVSRDDFVFPNWDPTVDYVEADYAELG
jgi:multiple sugar transport system substrate-binding protein